MKYLKQFGIVVAISLLGEILRWLIPLPVPASIYGLILMLAGLRFGWISLASVREVSIFLIDIMPLMFIPAAVGLLDSWGILKPFLIPMVAVTLLTTILVMAVTGRVTQFVIRWERRKEARP